MDRTLFKKALMEALATDTLQEASKKPTMVEYLKQNGWDETDIALFANAIVTYKKWYKRQWRDELAHDMSRSHYEPFGYGKKESAILQQFRNEFYEDLWKITTKDIKDFEEIVAKNQ